MSITIDNKLISRFSTLLDDAKKIVVISHMNPDGDAVGSSLACLHWLQSFYYHDNNNIKLSVILPHKCPSDALYLPSSDMILSAENNIQECERLISEADLIFGVDFNNASRVQPFDLFITESRAKKILVDHHHNPDSNLFDCVISYPDLSSTCELIFWIFYQIGGSISINDDVARCLYHGINTDTGCFAYACEDSSLYEATAILMEHSLNVSEVHNTIVNNYSITKMRILGHLLSERLKIFEEEGFAYIYMSAEELSLFGGSAEDLEGLVNYTLLMKPIQVGAFVKQTDDRVRISLRSKNDFDVNLFASKYFGGGGHSKAAGARSQYDFNTTLQILEKNMLNELKKHKG